ncbi:MAG: hypothetical protein GVY36_19255 [Verrucomicrobia bacterium]|nr:hypothetical protein [Verrucomicrobiota bacterium]
MSIPNPTVIISLPRSGSSMTAGLFAKHGAWVGPCRKPDARNAKGYFESQPFKKAIIDRVGPIVHKGILAPEIPWKQTALNILRSNGYTGGKWIVKHSAMYYPLWHEFKPRFICVRRDTKAVAKSGNASGYLKNTHAIPAHVEAMDYVRDNLGGVDVFTDEVVRGDYSSLERAFDHAGIEMARAIVDEFVDPSLWHY